MRKWTHIILTCSAIGVCLLLSGCLPKGPVVADRITGPSTDRSQWVKEHPETKPSYMNEDYQRRAEEYAASRHLPPDMAVKIDELEQQFRTKQISIRDIVAKIQNDMQSLDTRLPEWKIPELEEPTLPDLTA